MSAGRRFLDCLFGAVTDGVVECRSLPSKRRAWATPGDWGALDPFVTAEVNQQQGIYVGVATRRDTSSGTTANLAQLPAVWVDFDAPPADVAKRLDGFPFPPTLQVGSGLGVHVYWRLREPLDLRDPKNLAQAASVLRRLSGHLGGDPGACDPARVLRLPNTYNHKYDTPRLVTLTQIADVELNLSEPDALLPRELIRQNQVVLEKTLGPGNRNDALFRLARSLRAQGVKLSVLVPTIERINKEQCDPPLSGEEVQELIRHAWSAPDASTFTPPTAPITIIHDAASNGNGARSNDEPDPETPPSGVVGCFVNLSTVVAEPVDWLWDGWLPRRKSVVIAGDPGNGKSMIAIDLAARLSRGFDWPSGGRAPSGRSLFLCAEDGLSDTIRPRLDLAGGDPALVEVLTAVRDLQGERPFNLAIDLRVLEEGIRRFQPALVVVDPISAYLGATDTHRDADVRRVLAPLLAVVDRSDAVLIWIAHLNKSSERRALYRPGASIAFVAAARVVTVVGTHPEQPDQRVLVQSKNNLAPLAQGVTYSVSEGRVLWGGPVTLDADEILQPVDHDRLKQQNDGDDLIAALRQEYGGVIPVREAIARAADLGIAERTLRRAATRAGLLVKRSGQGAEHRVSWVTLTVEPPE